jgi:tetratricopeptide (TPR) repeat protein
LRSKLSGHYKNIIHLFCENVHGFSIILDVYFIYSTFDKSEEGLNMSGKLYVKMWEEEAIIPTYPVGEPDKNPMFIEKRVYQGSSGKVYPLPFTDKIHDEKVNRKYKMIYLENKYVQIAILPELGGRIQRAYDKTNDYDFVYYNQVIKPALVGLAGPWISGGIEFNWPQHHRPSTFSPVDYYTKENEDGSKTVFVGEIDRMYGTKGMASFTLYPDKSYLEIKGQLYNRTPFAQTFLWWANPAVAVNDNTKSIFPPDVHAVFDHGKRDVSKFPIATGVYYKMDYSNGVDISRYKNIPVPTSYMAYHSDYNFVGGYDFGKNAGILHVADHHISPGKKQWTWGCGEFGKAWDKNLTDEDGPYIELMTGVYTDNQPDFTWLEPYEEKTFTQYFMPYKEVGEAKNANIDAAVNLEFEDSKAHIAVYTTSLFKNLRVTLKYDNSVVFKKVYYSSPEIAIDDLVDIEVQTDKTLYEIIVADESGKIIISYSPQKEEELKIPDAAKPALQPEEIKTNEELFLTGLHLEQYRHATYEPEAYYLEGLKRDDSDIRINNAYGKLLLRRGLLKESETYFRKAIEKITWKNPNPYDGEPHYNLGLTLKMQGKLDEAFDVFFKSTWNGDFQGSGYFSLAQIAAEKKNYAEALLYIEKSIVKNYHNMKARNLKCSILRKVRKLSEALRFAQETVELDKLDYGSRNELYNIYKEKGLVEEAESSLKELEKIMRDCEFSYLELSQDYAEAGFYDEAATVLLRYVDKALDKNKVYPMIYYNLAYFFDKQSNEEEAKKYYCLAEEAIPDYCFPNTLFSMLVLEEAAMFNGQNAMACYYLANLLYDKKQFGRAIELWEKSKSAKDYFPTTHRNLALAYYNKLNEKTKARLELEQAFELNRNDARVLFELDQLYKKLNVSNEERLQYLEKNSLIIKDRDDLFIEYVTLYNNVGQYETAMELIGNRIFHPWEGGEGKVISQYVLCRVELAKISIKNKEYDKAVQLLEEAKVYPDNLGEGKLQGAQENSINYYLGVAYEGLGKQNEATEHYEMASTGLDVPSSAMFYNDQPADTIFYQGIALLKLGREGQAKGRFHKLYDYGEKHLFDKVAIDYFAVSLPDFLVFDEDLNKKNLIHCRYLMGLGSFGLNNINEAKKNLFEARNLDINHQGIMIHNDMINKYDNPPC